VHRSDLDPILHDRPSLCAAHHPAHASPRARRAAVSAFLHDATRRDAEEGLGDQCTSGLNFQTARPRRDILLDYRTILDRVYRPAAYYARVRTVVRMLDRPALDRSASKDAPRPLFGMPVRDIALLWRLTCRIAVRQPRALWHFGKVFYECATKNPRTIGYVGMLAAFYLHLRPFSRFVVSVVDQQIAEIDSGIWQSPVVEATEYPGPASLPQLAQGHAMGAPLSIR
jgi:hypothetical protein